MKFKSNAVGRPTWTPSKGQISEVEFWASRGLTVRQISEGLNIAQSTFYEKCHEFPEFSDAFRRGRSKGVFAVSNALYESAIGGSVNAQIFYLRTRAGWSDNSDSEKPDSESKLVIHL